MSIVITSNFAKNKNHFVHRVGWLRASVLGANDGIVSTASLIIGVAEASTSQSAVLIAGIAALVAGSMSMAAGEYVSVFETAKLDIEIKDRFGKSVRPREWFLVPLKAIDEAVKRINDKTISDYHYEKRSASLVINK